MRVAAAAAGVCAALALSACQGEDPGSASPTTSQATTTSATPTATPTPTAVTHAWQLPLTPLTQPAFVDGVALVLAADGADLTLVAVDPADGTRLWSRPTTTSAVSAEEPLAVTPVGDHVAYYRPTAEGGASARLVIADVHTGQDLASSPVRIFSTPIESCDEPATRLCGTSRPRLDAAAERFSFVISTGRFGPAPDGQPPVGSRPVGPGGLIDLGARTPERVGVFRDGTLLWSMPVVAYFPEGTTTDAGWTFRLEGDHYIGSLHQTHPVDGVVDTGDVATASFEADTGKIAWSVRGTSLDCAGNVVLPKGVPVRCHYSGDAVFTDGVPDFSDVEVRLEGYVPSIGKRTWEFELGKGVAFLRGVRLPPLVGQASLLLGRGADQRVVDLTSGEATSPALGAIYLCPALTRFDTGRGIATGDPTLQACTAYRSRTTGEPSVATLQSLDQAVETPDGSMVVVAGPDRLTGYVLS